MKDYQIGSEKRPHQVVRKKQSRRSRSTIKLIFAWIVLVLIALFFVQQRISYIRTEKKVKSLLLKKRSIVSSILPLKLEERYLTRFNVVEKTAKETLHLQKPKRNQIIKLKIDPTKEKGN